MSMRLRYRGSFLGRHNQEWRVDILQESDTAFTVGELTFEAEEPLVIEWPVSDKEQVIQGSRATIRLESPGDRTYADMYTIAVGTIRMEVYKGTSLYWSGTLDPEFYEEPYERAFGYPVSFTFSDFGILDRLRYDHTGVQTLSDILLWSISDCNLMFSAVNTSLTSTYFPSSDTKARLDLLEVRSDNFYDEEGEPCTLKEVVEGILQPLSLRLVQRNGKIWVYDLNALSQAVTRPVVWDGDTQTMGVDKVANNVKVTFSPYSSSALIALDEVYGGYKSDNEWTNTAGISMRQVTIDGVVSEYASFYPDLKSYLVAGRSEADFRDVHFTIFASSAGNGLTLGSGAKFFHIEPMVSGPSACDGVLVGLRTGLTDSHDTHQQYNDPTPAVRGPHGVLLTTEKSYIPPISNYKSYYLRLTLEALIDPRYNPFNSEENNCTLYYNRVKDNVQWAFVPVGVTLYDAEGNALMHYVNSPVASTAAVGCLSLALGTWESGAASFGDAWLAYYDPEDIKDGCGILGWHGNHHCIGRPDLPERKQACGADQYEKVIFDSFKKMADGEYIPYPPQGGWIEVKVYQGIDPYDYGEVVSWGNTTKWDTQYYASDFWGTLIRWVLYKAPKVEVVRSNLMFNDAELEDIEYSGYINKSAKEDITIDTIVGTAPNPCPTARGLLLNASTHQPVGNLTRAGITDCPERLLIGTLYSQFADRKTVLTGEAVLDTGDLSAYTEQNQGEKVFMMSGEVQDIIADTSEVTVTEVSPDEYVAIEEVV